MSSISFGITFIVTIFCRVNCREERLPFKNQTFQANSDLKMYCGPGSIALTPSAKVIYGVSLWKTVNETTRLIMAWAKQGNGTKARVRLVSGHFSHSNWEILVPSVQALGQKVSTVVDNRDYMFIEATKHQAGCHDGGSFDCEVIYSDPDNGRKQEVVRATANFVGYKEVSTRIVTLAAPVHGLFFHGMVVRVLCEAVGPRNWNVEWSRSCPMMGAVPVPWRSGRKIELHHMEAIQPESPEGDRCRAVFHKELVRFVARVNESDCRIHCKLFDRETNRSEGAGSIAIKVRRQPRNFLKQGSVLHFVASVAFACVFVAAVGKAVEGRVRRTGAFKCCRRSPDGPKVASGKLEQESLAEEYEEEEEEEGEEEGSSEEDAPTRVRVKESQV